MDISTIKQIGDTGQIHKLSALIKLMENGDYNQKRLSASAIKKLSIKYGYECIPAIPHLFSLLEDSANQVRQYSLNAIKELVRYTTFTEQQYFLLNYIYENDPALYNQRIAAQIIRSLNITLRDREAAIKMQNPPTTVQYIQTLVQSNYIDREPKHPQSHNTCELPGYKLLTSPTEIPTYYNYECENAKTSFTLDFSKPPSNFEYLLQKGKGLSIYNATNDIFEALKAKIGVLTNNKYQFIKVSDSNFSKLFDPSKEITESQNLLEEVFLSKSTHQDLSSKVPSPITTHHDLAYEPPLPIVIFQDLSYERLLPIVDELVNKFLYPAWYKGCPIFFISKIDKSSYDVGEIPPSLIHNDYNKIISLLSLEQLNNLLDLVNINITTPKSLYLFEETVLYTPIEKLFRDCLIRNKIPFTPKVKLGKYYADFLIDLHNKKYIVECNGREYRTPPLNCKHNQEQKKEGYDIFRFSSSRILNHCDDCVKQILKHSEKTSSMHHTLEDLNEEQVIAVKHMAGPMRVLAPAGSGKTKTLVNRIYNLVNNGVHESEILALAFNKLAEIEMNSRVRQKNGLGTIDIMTFHAFGNDIIKSAFKWKFNADKQELLTRTLLENAVKKYVRIVYKRNKDPLDEYLGMLRKVKNDLLCSTEMRMDVEMEACNASAGAGAGVATSSNVTGSDVNANANSDDDVDVDAGNNLDATFTFATSTIETKTINFEPIFNEYIKNSFDNNFYNYDDMLYLAVRQLLADPILRRKLQSRYKFILVDEFQDLNKVQLLLLQILVLPENNLFICGDDDQMIYGFRGAELKHILEFNKQHPITSDQVLKINYRSCSNIVRHSKWLIDHNQQRISKDITPFSKERGDVELFAGCSLEEQANKIAEWILKHKNGTTKWSDFAILYRYNQYSDLLYLVLSKHNIPVQFDGVKVLNSGVGKCIFAYLTVIHDKNHSKPSHYEELLKKPNKYFTNDFIKTIRSWNTLCDIQSARSKLRSMDLDTYINLVNKLEKFSKEQMGKSPGSIVNDIVEGFSLRQFYKDQSKLSADIDSAADYDILEIIIAFSKSFETIESLYSYWRGINEGKSKKQRNNGTQMRSSIESETEANVNKETSATADTYADTIDMNLDMNAYKKDEHFQDKVKLSTIHKTKGNEYKNVAYFNLVSRITKRASESDMEDERRIAYVCVTRPIYSLFITTQKNELSPFVGEFFLNPDYYNLSYRDLEKKLKIIRAESIAISSKLHVIDLQINKLSKKFPELNEKSIHTSHSGEALIESGLLHSIWRGMQHFNFNFDFDLALKKYTKLIIERDNTHTKNLVLHNEIIDLGKELEYRKIIEQASCTH